MGETRIQLCGRLVARIDGDRIETDLPGRQGRVAFAFLAVNRHRSVTRDELGDALWSEALAANGGPFMFGAFSAADAYFAPVVMRVTRYGLPLSAAAQAYVHAVEAHPAVQAFVADAVAERDFIAEDEPYRSQP